MYSHCSLFIVQLYIHKENSIVITLIILMNALDVITVLAPYIAWLIVCWRRSHGIPVAVAATPGVMLQAAQHSTDTTSTAQHHTTSTAQHRHY